MSNLKYFLVVFVVFFAFLIENGDLEAQSTVILKLEEYQKLQTELEDAKKKYEITECCTLFRNGFHLFDKKYCETCLKQNFRLLNAITDNLTVFSYYSTVKNPSRSKKEWLLIPDVFDLVEEWSDDAIRWPDKLNFTRNELLKYADYQEKYRTLNQELRITAVVLWLVKTNEWRDDPRAKLPNERLQFLAGEFKKLHDEKNYTIIDISRGIIEAWRDACNMTKKFAPRMHSELQVVKEEFIKWYSNDPKKSSQCAKLIVETMKLYPPDYVEHEKYLGGNK